MLSKNLIRATLLLATGVCCNLSVGCGGAEKNQVVAPQQSEDQLRAESEEKIKSLENVDPASL